MVKKIGGKSTTGTPQSSPVQAPQNVTSTKVSSVGQIQESSGTQRATGIQRSPHKITAQQRNELFQMIEEEAEKMFAGQTLPENRKESIKGAVKMIIDGSIVDEEDK